MQDPAWANKKISKLAKAREEAFQVLQNQRLQMMDKPEVAGSSTKPFGAALASTSAVPDPANYRESAAAACRVNLEGLTDDDMDFAKVLLLEVRDPEPAVLYFLEVSTIQA